MNRPNRPPAAHAAGHSARWSVPAASHTVRLGQIIALIALMASCSPDPAVPAAFSADMTPPAILAAAPESEDRFVVRFNEEIRPVEGSYWLEPGPVRAEAEAGDDVLEIRFDPPLDPGRAYRLAGEAGDVPGNIVRFLFSFVGWNGHLCDLVINEVNTGRNSSKTTPHRDYVEFLATSGGNPGGMVFEWSSSVKTLSWVFPPFTVRAGDIIVLHLAPEGLPGEKDETGEDLAASAGVDSSPSARDFWCAAGGLPDENALVLLRPRAGEASLDALFYADSDKSGPVGQEKLAGHLAEIGADGAWKVSEPPVWEDAFRWNPSASRPIHRVDLAAAGPAAWVVGESGTQSPGMRSAGTKAKKAAGTAVRK